MFEFSDFAEDMGLFPLGGTKSAVPIFSGCPQNERARNTAKERHHQHHETLEVLCEASF